MAQRATGDLKRARAVRLVAIFIVMALAFGVLVARTVDDADSAVVTSTLTPIADTYVQSDTPTTNYGLVNRIPVDSSPIRQIFMRFDVSGLSTPIQSARLRLHVSSVADSQSPSGGSVALVSDNTWSETGTTYNNRPTSWGANVASFGAVNRNAWYEIPVTNIVTAGGQLTFGLRSTHVDGAFYDTRETGATSPQLIVVTGSDDPTTTSSSSTTTTTTNPSPIVTTTRASDR